MTRAAFDRRQARIRAGRCPRCDKPVKPWPLLRPDVCWGPNAAVCGRHWPDIHAAEARLTVKEAYDTRTPTVGQSRDHR